MSIKLGVNGVVRDVDAPILATSGAMRETIQGFCGVGAVKRQFFDVADNLARIDFKPVMAYRRDLDSSGNSTVSNTISFNALNSYGSLTVSGNTVRPRCNTRGNDLEVYGEAYSVSRTGRKIPLKWTTFANSFTIPISYSSSYSYSGGQFTGAYVDILCADTYLVSGAFTSGSQSVVYSNGRDNFFLHAGMLGGGYGSPYVEVSIQFPSSVTIKGRSIPLSVIGV